jgi:hypothetical protein
LLAWTWISKSGLVNFDLEIEWTTRENRGIPPNSPADSQSFESESKKSMNMGERNLPRSLKQLFAPVATSAQSCRGLENEDPYDHVRTFKVVCEFVKSPNQIDLECL